MKLLLNQSTNEGRYVPEPRLGPGPTGYYDSEEYQRQADEAIEQIVTEAKRRLNMHYRNGREAKNGDRIVQLTTDGKITNFGILYDAEAGNDYCNGMIAEFPRTGHAGACLCDCLHLDDVAALLADKGLDKRPAGK